MDGENGDRNARRGLTDEQRAIIEEYAAAVLALAVREEGKTRRREPEQLNVFTVRHADELPPRKRAWKAALEMVRACPPPSGFFLVDVRWVQAVSQVRPTKKQRKRPILGDYWVAVWGGGPDRPDDR